VRATGGRTAGAVGAIPAAAPLPMLAAMLVATLAALLGPAAGTSTTGTSGAVPGGATARVIVRGTAGSVAGLEAAVTALGGHVRLRLPIINGFAATLPEGAEARVRALPGAVAVTGDASGHVRSVDPALTPDQVKALLASTATSLPAAKKKNQGAGLVNVRAAELATTADIAGLSLPRTPAYATGTGSLELARGSSHVVDGGVALTGEQDIFGQAWNASSWAAGTLAGTTWSAGAWNGSQWTGADWTDGANWAAVPRLGRSWRGASGTGRSWTGRSWAGTGWDGRSWLDTAWTSRSWADRTWSSGSWS
jgi:hypothetical protein